MFGRGSLLLSLLLLALLVDARHLRRGETALPSDDEGESVPPIVANPGRVADRWAARLRVWPTAAVSATVTTAATWTTATVTAVARWTTAAKSAACALAAYTVRDVIVVLGTHTRQPGESRLTAMAYGRLSLRVLQDSRLSAMTAAMPADTIRGRFATRGIALAGLMCLLGAGLLLAPMLAEQVGDSLTGATGRWLAGVFDYLGHWWEGSARLGRSPPEWRWLR